jgi:PAS domain S-box-containing protein
VLGGEIVGRVWSFRDVTDQVVTERIARESAVRFQEALENVPLAAVAIDTSCRMTFVNGYLEELSGWSRDELVGRRWSDVFNADDGGARERVLRFEDQLSHGQPPALQENTLTTKDGRVRLLSWANTPLHGADGSVNGVACVGEDITDRRAAEQALRHSEERFRALTENALEWVSVLSPTGTILYESRSVERLFGHNPNQVVGRSIFELIHPDDVDEAAAMLRSLLAEPGGVGSTEPPGSAGGGFAGAGAETQSVREFEVRVCHSDGSWHWLNGSARNLVHEPAVGGIVLNARDVTELRESQEQLLHAQKLDAVGRLAGGVAHDFNNLLTAIRGYAELMLVQLPSSEPLRADAEEIARAAERAASLTRQLLAFSRRQLLQPMVLELNCVVREIENLLRRLIGEDVELVTSLDPLSGRVKADPGQLEQVLVNLAVNARDAMPGGGRLTISTQAVRLTEGEHGLVAGPYALLRVADTGVGMDEVTLSHVFEPFFTTKEQGKGTGLGLATVYGIVKQSGGDVVVESSRGRGSSFAVYLPQVVEPLEVIGEHGSRNGQEPGSETVLLVEDEDLVRALASRVLQQHGYTVLEAAAAPAALDLSSEHSGRIDLLLTDVVMPKMSGRQLAAELGPLRPEMRVLYTSGYNEEAIGRRGVTDLGGAFLSKPFTPATLVRKVREVLDS